MLLHLTLINNIYIQSLAGDSTPKCYSQIENVPNVSEFFLLRMENSSKLRPMLSVFSFTFWTLYQACHDPQALHSQPDLYDQSVEIRFHKLRVEYRAMIQ